MPPVGSSPNEVTFRVSFLRVPYYSGDLRKGPNLENDPCSYVREPKRDSMIKSSSRLL